MEEPNPLPEPSASPELPRHPELPPPALEVYPPFSKAVSPQQSSPVEIAHDLPPVAAKNRKIWMKLLLVIVASAIGSWTVLRIRHLIPSPSSSDHSLVNREGHAKAHSVHKQTAAPAIAAKASAKPTKNSPHTRKPRPKRVSTNPGCPTKGVTPFPPI